MGGTSRDNYTRDEPVPCDMKDRYWADPAQKDARFGDGHNEGAVRADGAEIYLNCA
jgi:hypothetical protein